MPIGQIFCRPQIVVLAEALWEGKVNPNTEYISISVKMSHFPFLGRRSLLWLTCPQVAGGILKGW